jgi:anti-sigma regulatory factor (Ser/Thr protein kinase)
MITKNSPGSNDPARPSLKVRIPPEAQHAQTVRNAVTAFASLHGVHEGDAETLLFAVGEALANAIEHGATQDDIEVSVEIESHQISACVTDYGVGFGRAPARFTPLPDLLDERGRGIPIMQRCSDLFEVESMANGGTVVRLVRFRRDESSKHQEQRAAL